MRHSLQFKLLVSFMAVIIILLAGALIGVSVIVKEQALSSRQESLQDKGLALASSLQEVYAKQGNFNHVDALLADADNFLGARIWIVDRSQQLVCMSGTMMGAGRGMHMQNGHMGMHHGPMAGNGMMASMAPVLTPALTQGTIQTQTLSNAYYGEMMQIVAVPIRMDDDSIAGVVVLMGPMSTIQGYMKQIYLYLFLAGVIAVIAALFLVGWLSRKIVQPLRAMQATADEMAKGNYKASAPAGSDDEVGRLGTSLNVLARDLDRYMAELDKMEKLRRDFTANVSHELRTPLTIIRGYDEALLSGHIDAPEERQRYYCLIQEETLRLERLIHDLLDLSRLQAAREGTDTERIPLADLVSGVMTKFQRLAEEKGICLSLEIGEVRPIIVGTGDRIVQLFMIFLDNAIKYTPDGGSVAVKVRAEHNSAVLIVADTGKGIPEADLPYIWERFYKVDKSHRRDENGTGLGLSIAKQIMDLHHAIVSVSSTVDKGTTLTVTFPAVATE